MILGRFPTSSDKPNVHNMLAVTVTMGGGGAREGEGVPGGGLLVVCDVVVHDGRVGGW